MDDLLYRPPQSSYCPVEEKDEQTINEQNILHKSVFRTILYVTIITFLFVPFIFVLNITTRPYSYTCDSTTYKLFSVNLNSISIVNTTLITPMFGIVTFQGNFITKEKFTRTIQIPEEDCVSAHIYLTNFMVCKTLRFSLAPLGTTSFLDKVKITIKSPPAIDGEYCEYSIYYILTNSTINETSYNYIYEGSNSYITVNDYYFYSVIGKTHSRNQMKLLFENEDNPTEYPFTFCLFGQAHGTYDMTSRCENCVVKYSQCIYDPIQTSSPFENNRSAKMFFEELNETVGYDSYVFTHPLNHFSVDMFPFIYLVSNQ
ncbi:Transmembrane protein [Entamoeba marina]